jgi:hypothetical protein
MKNETTGAIDAAAKLAHHLTNQISLMTDVKSDAAFEELRQALLLITECGRRLETARSWEISVKENDYGNPL